MQNFSDFKKLKYARIIKKTSDVAKQSELLRKQRCHQYLKKRSKGVHPGAWGRVLKGVLRQCIKQRHNRWV